MRIISGNLRGHQFAAPHGHRTHPMSDKVRGALFNILGDIEGLKFLDAFAGSGALAFEAASRGAESVTALEKDGAAHSVIDKNVEELKLGKKIHVSRANAGGWSIHNMERQFDIVLLDPPYDELQPDLLSRLVKRHVKPGGLAVLSYPGGKKDVPDFPKCEVVEQKNYGDAQLIFYRKA